MLQIPLRKEIDDYTAKVYGRITWRVVVCGAIAIAAIFAVVALTMLFGLPASITSWLVMFVAAPALFIGFWKSKDGTNPETLALETIKHLINNNSWVYTSESPYLLSEEECLVISKKQAKRELKRSEQRTR